MTAREMTPERLAEARAHLTGGGCPYATKCNSGRCPVHGPRAVAARALLNHIDALAADRDEARQEVAALRAQRGEIREAHRVERVDFHRALGEVRRQERQASTNGERWLRRYEGEKARAEAAEAKLAALVEAATSLVDLMEGDTDSCRLCGTTHGEPHYPECHIGALAASARGEP